MGGHNVVETISFHRGRLPHWSVSDRAYFVTMCQKGAIPHDVIDRWSTADRDGRSQFLSVEKLLDGAPQDRRVLDRPGLARQLMGASDWLCGASRGWRIYALCIMPSHIHMVMRNDIGRSGALEGDLASFKNYTARLCNTDLGRAGRFWAKESFDHWCRDEESVRRSVAYTILNPVRAGLVSRPKDWPWTRIGDEYAEFAEGLHSPQSP